MTNVTCNVKTMLNELSDGCDIVIFCVPRRCIIIYVFVRTGPGGDVSISFSTGRRCVTSILILILLLLLLLHLFSALRRLYYYYLLIRASRHLFSELGTSILL